MRRNSESYGRRWASWCWSSTPEKKARGSGRKNRDRLLRVQSQMRTEGYEVSIAQLFEWFKPGGVDILLSPEEPAAPPRPRTGGADHLSAHFRAARVRQPSEAFGVQDRVLFSSVCGPMLCYVQTWAADQRFQTKSDAT